MLKRAFLRAALAVTVAASMVAGILTTASPANADGEPPVSGNLGLVPMNVATDVIATDILIAPRPDERPFTPFRITAVQMAPMAKVLRDGTLDPNHAIAYWDFTFGFPRNSMQWPPFLPEPTTPWRFHLTEMPNGGITMVAPSQGSPLYSPPIDLPPDWLHRLAPAARAAIAAEVFEQAIAENLVQSLIGNLVPIPPAATTAMLTLMQQNRGAITAGVAPAPAVGELFGAAIADQFNLQTLAGALAVGTAALVLTAILNGHPCYAKTAQVLALILATAAAMVGIALSTTQLNRGLYTTAALLSYGTAITAFGFQIYACKVFVDGLYAAQAEPIAYAALVTASSFLMVSGGALLAVYVVTSAMGGLTNVHNWWGAPLPAGLLGVFGLG